MRPEVPSSSIVVEPLGADLVALAQCHALDATVFPHPSVPAVSGLVPAVWVAKRDGRVVGFVATHATSTRREVVGLAVDEASRDAGVGRALLRTVLDASAHLVEVGLHVSTGNPAAIALYRSEGFEIVRTLPRYYARHRFPDGGDAFRMIRRL